MQVPDPAGDELLQRDRGDVTERRGLVALGMFLESQTRISFGDEPGGGHAFRWARVQDLRRSSTVITDLDMPRMRGDALAEAIKEHDSSIPVLMVTGMGHAMIAQGRRPKGVDLVLGKPMSRNELIGCVGRDGLHDERRMRTLTGDCGRFSSPATTG
jgi:response regulator RpfG family c-di-GMP phosphodiesterase